MIKPLSANGSRVARSNYAPDGGLSRPTLAYCNSISQLLGVAHGSLSHRRHLT